MKVVGIIAEYNPFHSGHLYQLRQAREHFRADFIVVAMSGDFVQRGEPAVYHKYARTETALESGADLVLELPVCFATSSAEDFAAAGVALLDHLGVVDTLCFGSELGEISPLKEAAEILISEPEDYRYALQESLRAGNSFPKARAQAVSAVCASGASSSIPNPGPESGSPSHAPDSAALLSSPNNILGVEYLKALIRRGSSMEPVTIRRAGRGYHDAELGEGSDFSSASAIRQAIRNGDRRFMLPGTTPLFADDLTALLNARLLSLSKSGTPLDTFSGLNGELASRLERSLLDFATFSGRIGQLKSRQYTYTRISRALLHLLLGITDSDIALGKSLDYAPYARILGFRAGAGELLHQIKAHASVPIITKTAGASRLLDADGLRMFQQDLYASHLCQSLVFAKSGVSMKNEYTQSVIIAKARPESV